MSDTPGPSAQQSEQPNAGVGVALAVAAYTWWGLAFPFYLREVDRVTALEILAMRVLTGLPVAILLVIVTRKLRELWTVLTTWRRLRRLVLTTPCIALNWYAFTYAVVAGRLDEASFGYYINPLVTIALGMIFLGERMRAAQWIAVGIAAVATTLLGIGMGGLPLIALTLAVSFGLYGLLRKRADASAPTGLSVEMGLLFLPMLAMELWLGARGQTMLTGDDNRLRLMLLLAGPMTIVPLGMFSAAVQRVRLSTIGLLQYIAPTCQLAAALWFGIELSGMQWIAFALIWIAIGIFTFDSFGAHRRERTARRAGARAAARAEAMD